MCLVSLCKSHRAVQVTGKMLHNHCVSKRFTLNNYTKFNLLTKCIFPFDVTSILSLSIIFFKMGINYSVIFIETNYFAG